MKKIISILLAVMLVVSAAVISANAYSVFDEGVQSMKEAIEEFEADTGENVETARYYFQFPDGTNGPLKTESDANGEAGTKAPSWINEFNEGYCGIYYWATGSFPTPSAWTGYKAEKDEETKNVYYADVPKDVLTIIWNNGVDGGTDQTLDIYYKAAQSDNLKIEWLDPGENADYPDGVGTPYESGAFDGMIFVVNPDKVDINEFSKKQTCGGKWYYYLGQGCYSEKKDGECCNPDHFDADGNHIGEYPDEGLLGDVDEDGFVTVIDATLIQKYKAQLKTEDELNLKVADVDADGFVTVMDAGRIQRFKAKLCNLDGTTPYVEPAA